MQTTVETVVVKEILTGEHIGVKVADGRRFYTPMQGDHRNPDVHMRELVPMLGRPCVITYRIASPDALNKFQSTLWIASIVPEDPSGLLIEDVTIKTVVPIRLPGVSHFVGHTEHVYVVPTTTQKGIAMFEELRVGMRYRVVSRRRINPNDTTRYVEEITAIA